MSSLSWIVFDEVERQRVRRIMSLFEEKGTRDELGLGAVRDSIADHLFPGTSTLQTRVRYMLFVPWIYALVERLDVPPDRLIQAARGREVGLIDALRSGGEEEGVIGRYAGERLQRLPSSIYWQGLSSWGIRRFSGSQEAYFTFLSALRHRRRLIRFEDESLRDEGRLKSAWCAELPDPPADLLERADFTLTSDEAGFLMDRLASAQPDSLLTCLVRDGRHVACDYVWEHPDLAGFPDAIRRLIEHAEVFSAVMHGAALLYNLLLAEKRANEDWIVHYRSELSTWKHEEFNPVAMACWSLEDFWSTAAHESHHIRYLTRQFVRHWGGLVHESGGEVADLPAARDLVQSRERALKGSQSRFVNRTVLDNWGGRSGAERLTFRWREASSHIRDLTHAG